MQIETSDIYRAIRTLLTNSFSFQNILIQTKDKKNPQAPCFYIDFISRVDRQTATEFENNSLVFDVVYFSADCTLRDLLQKEKILRKIFKKPLKIELIDENDNVLNVQYQEIENISISLNEDDYILNCSLNLSVDQITDSDNIENRYDEYDNDELMNDLSIKYNLEV